MPLRRERLDSITEGHLQALISNNVCERKALEYKTELPGNSDADKREFLADVSSFANASGGDMIYGIEAKSGVPARLNGLAIAGDKEILRLEEIIQNGVAPRIPGIATRAVPLQNSKFALIVRIPRSWALPHMVTFKNLSRFYSRNSAGKYQLDVSEIRAAFALSEVAAERIRDFRTARLGNIIAGEIPVALLTNPKMVLHIVPLEAFDPAARFDLSILASNLRNLRPINASGTSFRYNLDGFLTFSVVEPPRTASSYVQVFRNGIIEAVEASLLDDRDAGIPSLSYEQELLEALPRFLCCQEQLGVKPPLFIMATMLGVRGYTLAVSKRLSGIGRRHVHHIDRDVLTVPEVLVESFDCDPHQIMKPVFDAVWNAAGWKRSMNYNDEGRWVGQ